MSLRMKFMTQREFETTWNLTYENRRKTEKLSIHMLFRYTFWQPQVENYILVASKTSPVFNFKIQLPQPRQTANIFFYLFQTGQAAAKIVLINPSTKTIKNSSSQIKTKNCWKKFCSPPSIATQHQRDSFQFLSSQQGWKKSVSLILTPLSKQLKISNLQCLSVLQINVRLL